jgi:hypothetical protein
MKTMSINIIFNYYEEILNFKSEKKLDHEHRKVLIIFLIS